MDYTLKLRPYQEKAIQASKTYFSKKKNGTLVIPTGGGKTFTAWQLLKEAIQNNQKILWVVHREYLIDQSLNELKTLFPDIKTSMWTADTKDSDGQVVYCMVLSSRTLEGHFDWVIIDEAHRAAADSYINLLNRISYTKKLCLTATPERLDNKSIDGGEIIYQVSYKDLVDQGYLAKPNLVIIKTGQAPIVKFNVNGDLTSESLKLLNVKNRNELVAKIVNDNRKTYGKTLIFACDIEHVNELQKLIPGSLALHSKMTEDKNKILKQFQDNKDAILINCEVFTEGFNQPDIKTIVMARPTTSKALWVQMIGRGSRILPDKKEFNLVIMLDDIAKYEYLVNEWYLTNVAEKEELQDVNNKRALIEAKLGRKLTELDLEDTSVSSIDAILKYKNLFMDLPRSIILNIDQIKSLILLHVYSKKLFKESDNIKNAIEQSYSLCVQNNEFSLREWVGIGWAYYKAKTQEDNSSIYKFFPIADLSQITTQENVKEIYISSLAIRQELIRDIEKSIKNSGQSITQLVKIAAKKVAPKSYITKSIDKVELDHNIIRVQTKLTKSSFAFANWIKDVSFELKKTINQDSIHLVIRLKK